MLILQIAASVLVACAMTFSLAHAAEMPGKMKLDKANYFAVQKIYHPGFTIGGISEPAAIIALAALWFMAARQQPGHVAFLIASLLLVVAMQVVYWIVVHPVNKVWLGGHELPRASARFFGVGGKAASAQDWAHLRKRWEFAHAARAALAVLALLSLGAYVVR